MKWTFSQLHPACGSPAGSTAAPVLQPGVPCGRTPPLSDRGGSLVGAEDRPAMIPARVGFVCVTSWIVGLFNSAFDLVGPVIGLFWSLVAVNKAELGQLLSFGIAQVVPRCRTGVTLRTFEMFHVLGLPCAIGL